MIDYSDYRFWIYRAGLLLASVGNRLQLAAYPSCNHTTGSTKPAYWCADCGAMRSAKTYQ